MITGLLNLQHLIIQIYCSSIRRAETEKFTILLEYPGIIETY